MSRVPRWSGLIGCAVIATGLWGCATGQPELVLGPGVIGNQAPQLEIIDPNVSINLNQGERFTIRWRDADPDSAAKIQFMLQDVDTGADIVLVSNIEENDTLAPDDFSVSTDFVPFGSYYLRGEISDGQTTVTVYAMVEATTNTRVVISIGEPGTNPLNVPPRVAVVQPAFNQGVAQDDTLNVTVQPTPTTAVGTSGLPYDPLDDTELYILLDLDDNPNNDDVLVPDPNEIIVLRNVTVPAGSTDPIAFNIAVDLGVVPPRENGLPYYVRATIIDPSNQRVHSYAKGTINILRSATGTADLLQVGTDLAGARFQGFNPGARLGSGIKPIGDFDGDGIDDFMLLAQFGVPRNIGNTGEGYLIYGLPNTRFAGATNVNTVSTDISGAIFEAPPNRMEQLHVQPEDTPRGLNDVTMVPDLSGDGRPELVFGLGLVDGIYQGRDDDPGDSDAVESIRITLQRGLRTRTINDIPDEALGDDDYQGVFDTYIDQANPDQPFANSEELYVAESGGAEPAPVQYTIIGFRNVLNQFVYNNRDDVEIQSATLELTPPYSGISELVTASQMITFADESTTFSDFAGGDQPGPEDGTDYEGDLAVSFAFSSPGDDVPVDRVQVDVTETIQALFDGDLRTPFPTWIIIPTEELAGEFVTFNSSEVTVEVLRPRLIIEYTENLGGVSNYNCYPDDLPNNKTDRPPDFPVSPPHDTSWAAVGSAIYFNSENRDVFDVRPLSQERLQGTSVALELVGMAPLTLPIPADGGRLLPALADDQLPSVDIFLGASDPNNESDRTRGARLQSGYYDFYNTSFLNHGLARPLADYFGEHVAWMPDTTNDGRPEIIISAPRNEVLNQELAASTEIPDFRMRATRYLRGSIVVYPGLDYGAAGRPRSGNSTQIVPWQINSSLGTCDSPARGRSDILYPQDTFEIYAEEPEDFLGGGDYAGDVNLDGVPDIICGAPRNDAPNGIVDTGAVYLIYGRPNPGNVHLSLLDDPLKRPPTLRIRGETAGDELGTVQSRGQDINGDRIDDVFLGSPNVDFGSVSNDLCGDFDGNGAVDANDLDLATFNACRAQVGDEVFLDDPCKPYDYDNDRDIDDDDREVFDCLVAGFDNCCPVDNGFVGVVFGNVNLDGDRSISQIGTGDLHGIRFYGAHAGDRAGADVVSAGDFNRDGFGDLLIAAPGVKFTDTQGRERMGVAYLIFGGTHLRDGSEFSLEQVGSAELPGMVFWTPFFAGRPNEAPIDHVGRLGDINDDGFDDIGLGITRADFIDSALPQDPNDPGTDPNIGRRPDDGNVYIIYGNNTGSNR